MVCVEGRILSRLFFLHPLPAINNPYPLCFRILSSLAPNVILRMRWEGGGGACCLLGDNMVLLLFVASFRCLPHLLKRWCWCAPPPLPKKKVKNLNTSMVLPRTKSLVLKILCNIARFSPCRKMTLSVLDSLEAKLSSGLDAHPSCTSHTFLLLLFPGELVWTS